MDRVTKEKRKIKRKVKKEVEKEIKSNKTLSTIITIICIIAFIAGVGFYVYKTYFYKEPVVPVSGNLEMHFLELGNKYTGDCIYIQVGDIDIIVDGGSRTNSSETIYNYIQPKMSKNNDIIEYVIVTHADRDHISSFAGDGSNKSLFEYFNCQTIIDFPLTNKTTKTYSDYVTQRDKEVENGAVHYTALQCWNNEGGAQRTYNLAEGIELEFLYQEFYEHTSGDENNYSVCFQINQGSRHFLFTGDLEKEGEASLIAKNNLKQVELFKAGHHGSKTSSNDNLLSIIKPKICVVTCVAGSDEYTDTKENQFPTQPFIDRISAYTDKVYVTTQISDNADGYESMNGNIVVTSKSEGVTVTCSNDDKVLKDSLWFEENRVCPPAWEEKTA